MERKAIFSEDRMFRYQLRRAWFKGYGTVLWIMLNPSLADEHVDDPTVRRVVGFSQRWGFSEAQVVNLYAYRTPDPQALQAAGWPVGNPATDWYIRQAAAEALLIVCAWGARGEASRVEEVLELLRPHRPEIGCLGRTKSGSPRHPLYLPAVAKLERLEAEGVA